MKRKPTEQSASRTKHELLTQLETYRQSQLAKVRVVIFLIVSALLFCGAVYSRNNDQKGIVVLFSIGLILYYCIYFDSVERYKKKLRQSFFPSLIESLWPGAKHSQGKGLTREEFEAGRIFLYDAEVFVPKNLIDAYAGATRIRLSEITASYQAYGAKNPTKIFEGLFLIADFNKDTRGRTYVLPDRAERLLGKPGQDIQTLSRGHGELVKTEDPEFEKYFAVYSTDQIEARYILSPSLMRALLEFRQKSGRNTFVSFINGVMYLGLSHGSLIGNVTLSHPVNENNLATPFSDLILIHDLIEKSLGTRIWTKG